MNGYAQESFGGAMRRGYQGLPVAIRTILSVTVIGYVVQILAPLVFGVSDRFVVETFGFLPTMEGTLYQPWRLVTYMFLHGGFWHLLFNMLWLWWMGRIVEETLGSRVLFVLYFGAGIGGALINLALAPIWGDAVVTIGASGAVFGIMVAFAMIYPTAPIILFLLPPIQARYVVAGLIVMDLLFQISGSGGNVARLVHLGGAFMGWALLKLYYRGYDYDRWLKSAQGVFARKAEPKKVKNKSMRSVSDAVIVEETDQPEVDRILDKISKSGYDGLTAEEKRKLFEMSRRNP